MWFWIMAVAHLSTGPAVGSPPPPEVQGGSADTVVVRMVNKSTTQFAFEPKTVTVHQGDVLEFVQTGNVPHDVSFTKAPSGAKISSIMVGPMLTATGQTYDLVIDARFPVGHYDYNCLPHLALGMKGSFEVVAAADAPQAPGRTR